MTRPNLLLITTDQQSADMLGCAGNPDVKTPHLDALAADGVRFEKAYAAQPLCIPQRCSWYTGLMPHQHGVTFNLWDKELETPMMMGTIFQAAGFATGYSGKWHINVPPENPEQHGFEWTSNIRDNGADAGIVPDFERFLSEKDDRPFLFSASFNNPHNICEAARGGPFPDGEPGLPENLDQLPPLPDNFEIPENEPSVIREVQHRYGDMTYPVAEWDDFRWRLHRWFYCRMVEMIDRHVGDLLEVLKQSGHGENTLIVFSSDHGDGNAHHQWNQKQSLYDESARVPFLVCRPGSGRGRVDTERLVNTGLDLIPTLCGLGGIKAPEYLEGVDWSGVLSPEPPPSPRDHVVIETEFGTFGQPAGILGRAVRTARYKYMVYSEGEQREFLADMDADPGETVNYVSDPTKAAELECHRELLLAYIRESGDGFPPQAVG
jgi:choline-sulfatase